MRVFFHKLVIVLNCGDDSGTFLELLAADGVPHAELPIVVDADMNAVERKRWYERHRLLMITTRIVVVDLLMNRLPRESVDGILVWNAHRVTDASPEAFILRLYRERNPTGFIKAFSEDPETLTSGFNRLEKTLRALYVSKVFIWPRFNVVVAEDLAEHVPEVVELTQALTPLMETIQKAIIECMDDCVAELKRSTRIDVDDLTLENSLFESFDVAVRRELDPIWTSVKPRTKAVINDLRVLRKLLGYLLRYDAVNFFDFIDMLRIEAVSTVTTSTPVSQWMFQPAGERLFRAARARLYTCRDGGRADAAPVEEYATILDCPLIVQDRAPPSEEKRKSALEARAALEAPLHNIEMTITLERNPKWALLQQVLNEARERCELPAAGDVPSVCGSRVLVVLKDERTCRSMSDLLSNGPRTQLEQAWERHVIKYAARTRKTRLAVLSSFASLDDAVRALPVATQLLLRWLPADERELWTAAELGGRSRGAGVAADAAVKVGSDKVAKVAGASVDEAGTLTEILDSLNVAMPAVPVDGTDFVSADIPPAPAPALAANIVAAAPGAAKTALPQARMSMSGAPMANAEMRLMWKAAAQVMERERQVLLALHGGQMFAALDAENLEIAKQMSLAELHETQTALNAAAGVPSAGAPAAVTAALNASDEVVIIDDDDENAAVDAGVSAANAATMARLEALRYEPGAPGLTDDVVASMVEETYGRVNARKRAKPLKPPAPSPPPRVAVPSVSVDDDEMDVIDVSEAGSVPVVATLRQSKASATSSSTSGRGRGRGRGGKRTASADALTSADARSKDRRKGVAIRAAKQASAAASVAAAVRTTTGEDGAADTATSAAAAGALQRHLSTLAWTTSFKSIDPTPRSQVVLFPLSRMDTHASLLTDMAPDVIVMYDPDPTFTREVEMYQATYAKNRKLIVYFLLYGTSAEEQRYLSALKKERKAFERLIAEKSHMSAAPPVTTDGGVAALVSNGPVRKTATDSWGMSFEDVLAADGRSGGTAGALLSLTAASATAAARASAGVRPLSVEICTEDRGRRRVIVDMREFRAKLPMRLYTIGLNPVPATLEVGDFVLSPDMVVERKSVPDLFGSFNSGRLYTQADAMVRLYKRPLLCIEFDEDRPFTLQVTPELPNEIEINNPVSKIVLLTLHFPTLRILWCRSPNATATYFAALKQAQEEPDVDAAVAVSTEAEAGGDDVAAEARNVAAMDMLRRLPGVNATNVRALAAKCTSLHGLALLSQAELTEIMGAAGATVLHTFLHAQNARAL